MHTFKVVQQSYDMSTVSFPVLSLSIYERCNDDEIRWNVCYYHKNVTDEMSINFDQKNENGYECKFNSKALLYGNFVPSVRLYEK